MSLTENEYKNILYFLDSILASKVSFRKQVLLSFQQIFQYHTCTFFISENGQLSDPIALNVEKSFMSSYMEYYHKTDVLHPKILQYSRKRNVFSTSNLMPTRDYERTEFYNDFIRKQGLCHGLGVGLLNDEQNLMGGIGLWQPKGKEFTGNDVIMLRILAGYIEKMLVDKLESEFTQIGSRNLLAGFAKKVVDGQALGLTNRESEVLGLVLKGQTNHEISKSLFVSLPTVKTHLQNIFRKLNVKNKIALTHKIHQMTNID